MTLLVTRGRAGFLVPTLALLAVAVHARKTNVEFPHPEVPDLYDQLAESAWTLAKTTVVNNGTEDGLSWDVDPGEAIANVVRIYLSSMKGMPAVRDKEFLEGFFASSLGAASPLLAASRPGFGPFGAPHPPGGNLSRDASAEYHLAVLSLLLSRATSKEMLGVGEKVWGTAAFLSQDWIYEPYPLCLSVRTGTDKWGVSGNYTLQSEGDNEQRAVYARGAKGEDEMLIRWQAATGCWVLQARKRLKAQEQERAKNRTIVVTAVGTSVSIHTREGRAAARGGNASEEDEEEDDEEEEEEEEAADENARDLFRSCHDVDLVPASGWASVRGRGAVPSVTSCTDATHGHDDWTRPGDVRNGSTQGPEQRARREAAEALLGARPERQRLKVLALQRRTGERLQWALLEELPGWGCSTAGGEGWWGARQWCRLRAVVRRKKGKVGYLVFRGTADVHDVVTDLSMSKVHWLEEEGASWGVWSTVLSEVRASISGIRAAIRKSDLQHLIIAGHSLGGGYAAEAARQLGRSRRAFHRPTIQVVTFGAPAVFARREGGRGCRRGVWKQPAGWFEGLVLVLRRVIGGGRGCRAADDALMRQLHAEVLNVVNRWDLVPRAQLLPAILRKEGSKKMVQEFTKHLTQRMGGYAARFGGYISEALAIPHNFNRTMQGKRAVLERYEAVGQFVAVPPGIMCDFEDIAATSTPPPAPPKHPKKNKHGKRDAGGGDVGAWTVRMGDDVGGGAGGAGIAAAMLGDHQRYIAASHATILSTRLLQAVCFQEWGMNCAELLAKVGPLSPGGAGGSARLRELWVSWARTRQEEEADLLVRKAREEEQKRAAADEGGGAGGRGEWRSVGDWWATGGLEDSTAGLQWMAPGGEAEEEEQEREALYWESFRDEAVDATADGEGRLADEMGDEMEDETGVETLLVADFADLASGH